jgi:hypothetical protein
MCDFPQPKARDPVRRCPRDREERRKKRGLHVSMPRPQQPLQYFIYGIVHYRGLGRLHFPVFLGVFPIITGPQEWRGVVKLCSPFEEMDRPGEWLQENASSRHRDYVEFLHFSTDAHAPRRSQT